MPDIVNLVVIVVALKLVEAIGGLKFDAWSGAVGAALVCWLGGWGANNVLALTFRPEFLRSPVEGLWLLLAWEVITTMVFLLVAWAILPSVHVRRLYGLLLPSILIIGLRYAATLTAINFGL